MADELMVEARPKLSILVIEDTPEFAANAAEGLDGHDVLIVGTLEGAKEALARERFDVILSDVHFPARDGAEPEAHVSELLAICYESGIPLCFVTRADHHGMLDHGDEGYVSVKATTQGRIAKTFLMAAHEKPDERGLFRKLECISKSIREGSKTRQTWALALEMARNAAAKPTPLGLSIRKVRSIGLDVPLSGMKDGFPRVFPGKR